MKTVNKFCNILNIAYAVAYIIFLINAFTSLTEGNSSYAEILTDGLTGIIGITIIFVAPLLYDKLHKDFSKMIFNISQLYLMTMVLIQNRMIKSNQIYMGAIGGVLDTYGKYIKPLPCVLAVIVLVFNYRKELALKKRCTIPVTAHCTKIEKKERYDSDHHYSYTYYVCSYKFQYGIQEYELNEKRSVFPKTKWGHTYLEKPEIGHLRQFCVNLDDKNNIESWDMGKEGNADENMLALLKITTLIMVAGSVLLLMF